VRQGGGQVFEIVPGVPAATAVPAYAGIPAGQRPERRAADHPTPPRSSQLAYSPATLVVLGAERRPGRSWARCWVAAGWPETAKFAITWDGTTKRTADGGLHAGPHRARPQGGRGCLHRLGHRGGGGDAVAARDRLSVVRDQAAVRLAGCWCRGPRSRPPWCRSGCVSTGPVPEEVPTIAVEPPRPPQQMERAVKGLVTGRVPVGGVHLGEPRSAAVRERFEEYGLDARAFRRREVAAVGEQTLRVAARVRHPAGPGAGKATQSAGGTRGGLAALR